MIITCTGADIDRLRVKPTRRVDDLAKGLSPPPLITKPLTVVVFAANLGDIKTLGAAPEKTCPRVFEGPKHAFGVLYRAIIWIVEAFDFATKLRLDFALFE